MMCLCQISWRDKCTDRVHMRRGAELTDTGCDPKNKDMLICSLNSFTTNSLKVIQTLGSSYQVILSNPLQVTSEE